MKRIKKFAALMLALVMALAMALPAMAADNGSITINGTADVPLNGKTFKAYQVLIAELANGNDATGGVIYRVPVGLEKFYVDYFNNLNKDKEGYTPLDSSKASFDQDVSEQIAALGTNDSEALEAFAKAVLAAAKNTKGIATGETKVTSEVASVTISDLELGYYVVEDEGTATPISALALTTTQPGADVTIKASQPTIEKKIDGANDTDPETENLVDNNNASVGDEVPYVLNTNVPDMRGYEKYYFVINDTLSKGLDFNDNVDINIVVPDDVDSNNLLHLDRTTDANSTETTYIVNSVENADGTTSIEIVFKNFYQYRELAGAQIQITYSATINQEAVIGVAGNPNKVQLSYSNNPNNNPSGDPENPDKPAPGQPPIGVTPEDVTRTYVTGIELTKFAMDDTNKELLAGAEFEITGTRLNKVNVESTIYKEDENGTYWKLKDGSYTSKNPADYDQKLENYDEIIGKYESTTVKYSKTSTSKWITKAENVKITGITSDNGTLLFEGLAAGDYVITEIKAPNGYNMLKEPINVTISFTGPTSEAVTDCTWSATLTSENGDLVDGTVESSSGLIKFAVENKTGSLLPSTGGIGTTIFYVVGAILVIGAGVLLVTKRRMNAQ